MNTVTVDIVRVQSTCNAGLEEGAPFPLAKEQLGEGRPLCRVALASIVMNVGRLGLLGDPIYISCPDPGTGAGGNVLFRIIAEGNYPSP